MSNVDLLGHWSFGFGHSLSQRIGDVQTAALVALSSDAIYRTRVDHQCHARRGDADCREQRNGWLYQGDAYTAAWHSVGHRPRKSQHRRIRRSAMAHGADPQDLRRPDRWNDAGDPRACLVANSVSWRLSHAADQF